ncbi:MAG: hypothetical protein GY797_16230 [Deltaproteobacteria bacterium]|nr:hypothetical protein [Deltaproteobacteria bacterium]
MMKTFNNMPNFVFEDYQTLLETFKSQNRNFYLVSQIENSPTYRCVFLRHDVDFFLGTWDKMPIIENQLGIFTTYYICLSQYYNVFEKENKKFIHKLIDLGHEIGLHYDLSNYPKDENDMFAYLEVEINILSRLSGSEVKTIVMHQPHTGKEDVFKQHWRYVHPHSPKYQDHYVYISDSCRAFRDEKLLNFIKGNCDKNLLLTIHPELWLDGNIQDRIDYLKKILIVAETPLEKYYLEDVMYTWKTHDAVLLDEKRRNKERT